MDASERLAQSYLESLELGPVNFEPDGNIPPDFLVGGRIAVEVRRLNQNHEDPEGGYKRLEQLWIPLMQRLRRHLPSLGHSRDGECWYTCISFGRPLEEWRVLHPLIDAALLAFMADPARRQSTLQNTPNFTIDLLKSGKDHGSFFVLGASSDNDSGGWVMEEVARNLKLCITEKERKIAPYRAKYKTWRLVMADHIDYSMDPEDRATFRTEFMPTIQQSFEKIVLIDPLDHCLAFEA